MSIWVKICGLTEVAAVEAVVQAGVQAAGFVFADSPRRITPSRAAELEQLLSSEIASVAVFLRPAQAEVDTVLQEFQPDYIQADWGALVKLALPEAVTPMPVIREGETFDVHQLPTRFLFEGASSGVGHTVDWQAAEVVGRRRQLILAGGLDPENVGTAIRQVRPFGVDVSSGVESAPGIKDPVRILKFVEQVRSI